MMTPEKLTPAELSDKLTEQVELLQWSVDRLREPAFDTVLPWKFEPMTTQQAIDDIKGKLRYMLSIIEVEWGSQ